MFYLYVIIDPRTGDPIYVGKGSGDRLYQHWFWREFQRKEDNPYLKAVLNAIALAGYSGPIYEKWFESDDEDFIFWMEIFVIAYLGLENLCNRTRGGKFARGGRLRRKQRRIQAEAKRMQFL